MLKPFLIASALWISFAAITLADDVQLNYNKSQKTVSWTVPENIETIRIQSWKADGTLSIDRNLSVEPGQKFTINVIE